MRQQKIARKQRIQKRREVISDIFFMFVFYTHADEYRMLYRGLNLLIIRFIMIALVECIGHNLQTRSLTDPLK